MEQHPVRLVEDTQRVAPSFVHATQFDALQDDTDADEEARPAGSSFDPPAVIHHTMFSPSDLDTEESGGFHPDSGAGPARRRLVLVTNANPCQVEGGNSHDERLVRVRESLQRGNLRDRSARNAIELVSSLASRIGPVRDDQGVSKPILRQQWYAFNEPLMWAAAAGDRESPVLSWLANACDRAGSVSVASVDTIGHDAVFEAWHALSGVMRSWGTSHAKTCRSGSTGKGSCSPGGTHITSHITSHITHTSHT